MMQKLLTKYGLAFHVACVCVFPLACLSQQRVFALVPLLWLSLAASEMMFLLPSVLRSETLTDARQRVWKALIWDPFLYIGLALIAVVTVQWLNSGCKLVYLPDADVWKLSTPRIPWAPFSVEARAAFAQVSLFTACVAVALTLRTALSKTPKRLLLQGLVVISGCLAIAYVVPVCLSIQPDWIQSFGAEVPAMGTFFGFWLLMGMGLFADSMTHSQRRSILLILLGVTGNMMGMLFFASALAVCVYMLLTVLMFFYWMVYLSPHVPKRTQIKLFVVSLLFAISVGVVLIYVYPKNPVVAKIEAALPLSDHFGMLFATKKIRTAAAMEIWQEHPWVGVGSDGFYHVVGLSVAAKDWALMKTDQAYVYNDCLQFLCEYGVLGASLLLAMVVTLIAPVCYRARIAWQYGSKDTNNGQAFLLRLSPIVVSGVLATGVCFIESWVASPFRSPSLLLAWTCVMAALPAFLPTLEHAGSRG